MSPKNKIILIIALSILTYSGFTQRKTFINYSLDDGLPQSTVISIYQDNNRNIWLGTQSGLSKYNGRDITNYDTRDGLADNHITAILEDSESRFWFGHRYNGISLFEGGHFTALNISKQQINTIKKDDFDNIWIGTYGEGILILPKNKKPIPENFISIKDIDMLPSLYINDMILVDKNKIWVAAFDSFYIIAFNENIDIDSIQVYNPVKELFKERSILSFSEKDPEHIYSLVSDGLYLLNTLQENPFKNSSFFPFRKGTNAKIINQITIANDLSVWGTTNNGAFKFDGAFKHFTPQEGIPDEEMNGILKDVEGNIWIGSTSSGAYKFIGDKFSIIDRRTGLPSDIIISLAEDKQNNLWISTEKGVSYFDGQTIIPFKNKYGLDKKAVEVVFCDSNGNIWFGTFDDTPLIRYNPNTKKFRTFTVENGLSSNSILTIAEDNNTNIWFATLGLGASRYSYPGNNHKENISTFDKKDGLSSEYIWALHSDKENNIWFGCENAGLSKYDGESFTTFNDSDGLTNLSPGSITHDSKNNIWIASIGGGVFKYDGYQFINYNVNDGLSSDSPFSIICDDNDKIWIGTNSGIDKLDPITEKIKHYGKQDGFLGIENNQNAVCKSHDGILWFGTMKGVVRFDPTKDKPNTIPTVTLIKKIKLFHSYFDYSLYSDSVDSKTKLPKNLVLPYNKNHITFEFVGITMVSPDRVRYKYKLDNFDDDWTPLTSSGVATYTNTPPGEYIFKVKSCNSDGVWNDFPMSFNFTVLPPFWKTWWFLSLSGIFVFCLIYLIYNIRLRSINTQKIKLEKLVDEKTKELSIEANERKKAQEKAENADKLKTTFLANMSHEIRTPVSAIIGFSDLLKEGDVSKTEMEKYLGYISRGGQNLLTLINDIMDISKIEVGQLRIEKEEFMLNSLLSETLTTFIEEKNNRGKDNVELKLIRGVVTNDFKIYSDPFRIQQVFNNLLSNALKFTDEGYIKFGYTLNPEGELLFFVKDTGLGIPKEMHEVIFDRFRQVEESYTKNKEGTGLGLAISRKLTELLGGKIWIESNEEKGSSFYFSIPRNGNRISEKVEAKDFQPTNTGEISFEGKTILVVEDEDSNYRLLDKILKSKKADVVLATDGFSAIDIIRKNGQPIDLVLMDIKLPDISGYEATKKIKEIREDLPIIAQTAFNMVGEKERCLELGFDDFISKPFDKESLFLKINKWI